MRILIIDDDPAIRLLAATSLEHNDGFEVTTARDGREGVALARANTFDLILLDQLMPDMPGRAVLEELRKNPTARQSLIAFFTAKTSVADVAELHALDVADVIGKPFDPDELSAHVIRILQDCGRLDHATAEAEPSSLADQLADEFVSDGLRETDALLSMLDDPASFNRTEAEHIAHRWVGRGGTFGYPNVTELARQIETDIAAFPDEPQKLATNLLAIKGLFEAEPPTRGDHGSFEADARPATPDVVEQVKGALAGSRIAAVGFDHNDASRLARTFEAAGAFARVVETADSTEMDSERLSHFDLVLQRVHTDRSDEHVQALRDHGKPTLYVGPPDTVSLSTGLAHGDDVVVCPVTLDELLLRAYRLLSADRRNPTGLSSENRLVIIADDDPTVTALLEHTLTSYEFECHVVMSGGEALAQIQRRQPAVVILDVNMPGMTGFEVLSHMKSSSTTRSIPVVMVTARSQESDVLHGFALGAADYVSKPFNPIEVAMRVRRILDDDHRPVAA